LEKLTPKGEAGLIGKREEKTTAIRKSEEGERSEKSKRSERN